MDATREPSYRSRPSEVSLADYEGDQPQDDGPDDEDRARAHPKKRGVSTPPGKERT